MSSEMMWKGRHPEDFTHAELLVEFMILAQMYESVLKENIERWNRHTTEES